MPQAFVKKLADKHNVSISTAERKWEKAKKLAKEQGQEDNYAYITGIFKHLMGESVNNDNVVSYIRDEFNNYVQKHGAEWTAVNLKKVKQQISTKVAKKFDIDVEYVKQFFDKVINESFVFPKLTLKQFLLISQ